MNGTYMQAMLLLHLHGRVSKNVATLSGQSQVQPWLEMTSSLLVRLHSLIGLQTRCRCRSSLSSDSIDLSCNALHLCFLLGNHLLSNTHFFLVTFLQPLQSRNLCLEFPYLHITDERQPR